MSDRRNFFSVVTGILLGLFCPKIEKSKLRKVEIWTGKGWQQCRMMSLKKGDVFRLEGYDEVWKATKQPNIEPRLKVTIIQADSVR